MMTLSGRHVAVLLAAALLLGGCNGGTAQQAGETQTQSQQATAAQSQAEQATTVQNQAQQTAAHEGQAGAQQTAEHEVQSAAQQTESREDAAQPKNAQAQQQTQETVEFTDALGRSVQLPKQPQRVAALIGSFADIWTLSGGGDTLVAAAHDAWTSFDLGLTDKTADLGSVKEPNLEALLAAEPDLILASSNTAADVELLATFEQAGIPTVYFEVEHFDDYLEMLRVCTELTDKPENYERYGTEVAAQVEAARARQDGSHPRVLYIRASGSSCKAKGSEGSVLGEMLADLGCVNVADGSGLLENLSMEAIMEADPDYIFAVLQGADKEKAQQTLEKALLSNPAWGSLRAVQEGRFHTMDHRLYNLKPNARWGEAYSNLADILYAR